jgi:hypothetical protein
LIIVLPCLVLSAVPMIVRPAIAADPWKLLMSGA